MDLIQNVNRFCWDLPNLIEYKVEKKDFLANLTFLLQEDVKS